MAPQATLQGRARAQATKTQPFGFSIDDLSRAGATAADHWGREGSRAVDKWMRALGQPQLQASPTPSAPRHYQTRQALPPEKRVMTSKDYARADARKRAAATPGVVRAFNNGASFNTIDEIDAFGASLETGVNNLGKRLGLTKGAPYNMRDAYDAVHAAEAEATRDYARRRPIVSGAAGIAGAVANPLNKVGIGWVAKGGNLSNVAARSAALGGLNGAASGAGEGRSLEERVGNARNGMIFGAMAGGAAPYVARGLETAVGSAAKVVGPRVRALADQIPAPVSQAYTDVVRRGSDVFARGWPPRKPAVDAVPGAPPLAPQVRSVPLGIKALPEFHSPFDLSGGRSAVNVRKPYYPGDLTSHPEAHAFPVHGGDVMDAELIRRSRTGVKPDGVEGPIPAMSSAFHSDDYLRWVDQTIRENGALKAAAARQPGQPRISVDVQDIGDLGEDLGRGYRRIWGTGNKEKNLTVHGPSQRIDGLRSATGYYELNPLNGRWENISLFPELYK
jgi:hypothetical protein